MLNLRDQLNRFSLIGPHSFTVLNSIFKLVLEEEHPNGSKNEFV